MTTYKHNPSRTTILTLLSILLRFFTISSASLPKMKMACQSHGRVPIEALQRKIHENPRNENLILGLLYRVICAYLEETICTDIDMLRPTEKLNNTHVFVKGSLTRNFQLLFFSQISFPMTLNTL